LYRPQRLLPACLVLACCTGALAQTAPGIELRPEPDLIRIPIDLQDDLPVFISADEVRGVGQQSIEAEGNAMLRRRGQAVFADFMRHDRVTGDVVAQGSVVLVQRRNEVLAPYLFYNLERSAGFIDEPVFFLPETGGGRGSALRMFFEGESRFRAERARYTTCGPEREDWVIRADELQIDHDRNVGVARGAALEVFGTTLAWLPVMSFPLVQERKSGFLAPTWAITGRGGPELTVPYFWAMAPNRDYTLLPRFIARRGLQLGNEFRYLEPNLRGSARFELLPGDNEAQRDRWLLQLRHWQTALPGGWTAAVDFQRVSDDAYFRDLTTRIALTSQVNLLQDITAQRGFSWGGSLLARVQRFQTLQDPLQPVVSPYFRLPQLVYTQNVLDWHGADLAVVGEFVNFVHPTLVQGRRAFVFPSATLPLQTAWGYVRPRVGLHLTRYALDPASTTLPSNATRAVPIFSVDSGVVLERDLNLFGQSFTQTLEPRVFYTYIPFVNQSRLPVFDSAVPDPNFVSLFTENFFTGHDRISDANQVTTGVVSRLIDPATGAERLRAALAQRFHFTAQRVTLPGAIPRSAASSDIIGTLTGQLWRGWIADAGIQYNTSAAQVERALAGVRFAPEPGKVFNASYRFVRGQVQQYDLSAQWRLSARWTALGRWNYSVRDNRLLEGLAGFQYDADCWTFRFVFNRIAIATQQASTAFFFQIELRGLSRVDGNPLEILRRSIPGYTQVDPNPLQPVTDIPYPLR
jgi:LPS-assembly protein